MNTEMLLRALREAEADAMTPPHVEAAVLAAWDAAHAPAPASRVSWSMWHRMAAAAAAVTLTVTLTMLGGRLRAGLDMAAPEGSGSTLMLVGEPILRGEPVRVVRMRMPASTLGALGIRSLAGESAEAVDVDVIVGEDGVARAIRLGM